MLHLWVCYCPRNFITGSDKPVGSGPLICCSSPPGGFLGIFFWFLFVKSSLTQHIHKNKMPQGYLTNWSCQGVLHLLHLTFTCFLFFYTSLDISLTGLLSS
ncbi:hypothetical protein GOODEAATRI_002369 [Goodea atripinnis]|uniref:Uncharacterized protein n=1 Tax=Goodea atripinnis TaxID=208336 RepID=A0ABV0MNP9_9TELE